jgi:hypothetical protein
MNPFFLRSRDEKIFVGKFSLVCYISAVNTHSQHPMNMESKGGEHTVWPLSNTTCTRAKSSRLQIGTRRRKWRPLVFLHKARGCRRLGKILALDAAKHKSKSVYMSAFLLGLRLVSSRPGHWDGPSCACSALVNYWWAVCALVLSSCLIMLRRARKQHTKSHPRRPPATHIQPKKAPRE